MNSPLAVSASDCSARVFRAERCQQDATAQDAHNLTMCNDQRCRLLKNDLYRKRRGLLESSGGQGQGAKQGQRDRAKARGNRTQETFTRRLITFKGLN